MSVNLISPSASLVVLIESAKVDYDPIAGARVVEPAKRLQFSAGRCSCPDELWPQLERHGAYTGLNQTRIVWREDEDARPEAGKSDLDNIQVISGMQTARGQQQNKSPMQDWDKLSVQEIGKRVKRGEVKDLSGAIAYEAANRKRRMVMRALAEGMAESVPRKESHVEPVAEDVESGISDTFSAGVSTDK